MFHQNIASRQERYSKSRRVPSPHVHSCVAHAHHRRAAAYRALKQRADDARHDASPMPDARPILSIRPKARSRRASNGGGSSADFATSSVRSSCSVLARNMRRHRRRNAPVRVPQECRTASTAAGVCGRQKKASSSILPDLTATRTAILAAIAYIFIFAISPCCRFRHYFSCFCSFSFFHY